MDFACSYLSYNKMKEKHSYAIFQLVHQSIGPVHLLHGNVKVYFSMYAYVKCALCLLQIFQTHQTRMRYCEDSTSLLLIIFKTMLNMEQEHKWLS